jgi:hypothetical protein
MICLIKKITWTNGRHSALLDRFLCSMQWDSSYSQSVVRDLAKYGSDHCPLVLHTSMTSLEVSSIFKCDIVWFDNPEFNALVIKWWSECILKGDIGKT